MVGSEQAIGDSFGHYMTNTSIVTSHPSIKPGTHPVESLNSAILSKRTTQDGPLGLDLTLGKS